MSRSQDSPRISLLFVFIIAYCFYFPICNRRCDGYDAVHVRHVLAAPSHQPICEHCLAPASRHSGSCRFPAHAHMDGSDRISQYSKTCTLMHASMGIRKDKSQSEHATVSIREPILSLLLRPFQIIRYSNNLGESKFFIFDQIYITE